MILASASSLLQIYPQFSAAKDSLKSFALIINSNDLEHNQGKKVVDHIDGGITFNNVCYTYPNSKNKAIKNFSLKIQAGQSVAFVGESGSGKSTLMSLAIGFNRPDAGEIILDEMDMNEIDMRTYRTQISVVPQSAVLFSGSIRENICYGLANVSDDQVRQAISDANLDDLINELPLGMETSVGESGIKLSGGQRQRIVIARALIRKPKFILLDEATSALDTISEKLVQDALNKLTKGRTTFIVAHRLSTIRNVDLIVAMQNGEIVEQGTEAELMANKSYFYKLASTQTL